MTERFLKSIWALFFVAAFAGTATALAAPDLAALNRVLTDRVTVPAYSRMADEMTSLAETLEAFCAAPDDAKLSASWAAFANGMAAWQQAQVFTFGPIIRNGRAERIEFWPDKNGTRARQLAQALAAKEPALLAPGGLVGKSVSLQNLVSLEQLLDEQGAAIVADPADEEARYACGLARAMAEFQAALAQEILADWTGPGGYRDAMVTAVDGNSHYGSAAEAAAEYLRSPSFELEKIVKMKLRRPLGDSLSQARPKRAESWRSQLSLKNIEANLQTVAALYEVPGGLGDQVVAAGAEALDRRLRLGLAEVRRILDEIDIPLSQAVADEAARADLEDLEERLEDLHHDLTSDVARALALPIGFNAMDGD